MVIFQATLLPDFFLKKVVILLLKIAMSCRGRNKRALDRLPIFKYHFIFWGPRRHSAAPPPVNSEAADGGGDSDPSCRGPATRSEICWVCAAPLLFFVKSLADRENSLSISSVKMNESQDFECTSSQICC